MNLRRIAATRDRAPKPGGKPFFAVQGPGWLPAEPPGPFRCAFVISATGHRFSGVAGTGVEGRWVWLFRFWVRTPVFFARWPSKAVDFPAIKRPWKAVVHLETEEPWVFRRVSLAAQIPWSLYVYYSPEQSCPTAISGARLLLRPSVAVYCHWSSVFANGNPERSRRR